MFVREVEGVCEGGSKVVVCAEGGGRREEGGREKTCLAACVDKAAILGLDPVFFLTVSTCCGLTLFAASSLATAFVILSLCFSRSSFSRSFCIPSARHTAQQARHTAQQESSQSLDAEKQSRKNISVQCSRRERHCRRQYASIVCSRMRWRRVLRSQ